MYRAVGLCFGIGALALGGGAQAQVSVGRDGVTFEHGAWTASGRAAIAGQVAAFEPIMGGDQDTAFEFDASALITIQYEAANGYLFGVRSEIDTGNRRVEEFERDEIYAFAATEWGRLEVGENDGPADTLSFHAPVVGLGQVRGDFARYTGSVALLSPVDSRDSFKVTYLSPPQRGVRLGVSYAPNFRLNADAADPRDRFIQEDVVEFAAQHVRSLGAWVAGVSGAYVTGAADQRTEREDIESWSVGGQVARGPLIVGAAYVDRGRSNLRSTADPRAEVNAGVSWRADRWVAAASYAETREEDEVERRYGLGGEFEITRDVYVRADFVRLTDNRDFAADREGWVGLTEIGFRF